MFKMNIANYLIGELANEAVVKIDEAENLNVINGLVDNWSSRRYVQPKSAIKDNEYKISFEKMNLF